MIEDKKIGLSLSGGGYRAAAFHIGALRRLQSMGVLEDVDVISTISGGSIAGAYYALHKEDYPEFEDSFKKCLKKGMIIRMIFSWPTIIFFSILIGSPVGIYFLMRHHHPWFSIFIFLLVVIVALSLFQFTLLPFTKTKERIFRKIFFQKTTMGMLPEKPLVAINATNLETGTLWTFSREKMGDSTYSHRKNSGQEILFKAEDIPVALAVNSSTNVPAPFGPVRINKKYFEDGQMAKEVRPALMDGGLYDNQGIHKITQLKSTYHCKVVICCDGSEPFSYSFNGRNSYQILFRTTDIMMRRIKNLQFVRSVYESDTEIAYYSLNWTYRKCLESFVEKAAKGELRKEVMLMHNIDLTFWPEWKERISQITILVKKNIGYDSMIAGGLTEDEVKKISQIKTNLSAFTEDRIEMLAKHGSVLTGIQISLYCPTLNINNHAL